MVYRHTANIVVFKISLTSYISPPNGEKAVLSLSVPNIPDGSFIPNSVMPPPLLLLLALPGLVHGGLLGAGTGLGSCAAPPFR